MTPPAGDHEAAITQLAAHQGPWLSMRYEAGRVDQLLEATDVLAVLEFGASPLTSRAARHVPVALKPLDPEARHEVWRTRGPVETGRLDHVRFARGLDLTMGHIALDVQAVGGIRAASRLAYRQLENFLARSVHRWPLKIWNYIPGINQGSGDGECYRQFCVGRAEALAEGYDEQPPLPAATAIGVAADEAALQVYFLAGSMPGLNVENPRQVNAWRYPRQYGPRSPLFSRGTIVELGAHRQFLISGTASVIGHETRHADDVRLQTLESLRNVDSLISEGHRLLGLCQEPQVRPALLKIYLRSRRDLPLIRKTLDEALPDTLPRMFLEGDVCRRDLLIEMDGIALLEQA